MSLFGHPLFPSLGAAVIAGALVLWSSGNAVLAGGVWLIGICGAAASFRLCGRGRGALEAAVRGEECGALTGDPMFGRLADTIRGRMNESQEEIRQADVRRTAAEARIHLVRRENGRALAALDALPVPLFLSNSSDAVIFANTAACELWGEPGQGQTISAWLNVPEICDLVRSTRSRSAATDSRKTECELVLGDVTRQVDVRCTNLTTEDAPLGVMTVINDIADQKEAEQRHAEFVSSASHELKTPLAGIKAYVEMLADGDASDPDEQLEMYEFIDGQVDRLTRLIENMLNLARIQSGVIQVNRVDSELNSLLQKAADVVEPTAEEKQITLKTELSDLYLPVQADQDLFGQAIINLLSNAVKYTPSGGAVTLRSRMDETQAVIEVADTGMGIPQESLPKIFDRFYRVPENNQAAAGTGLGLALVHYIVTNIHSGQISVTSVVDEGSTFRVTVPLGHRKKPNRRLGATTRTPAAAEPGATTTS